ncbi:hypothetical protein VIS19158_21286 [Vibrio scophthalmi LMG 19158]|uniref:Uncharacterized protein n=1 Tax=Vibrio scophthalmi LMG 19158 TaxID=870967 RepID=F9RTW5_9VIBR|nr:hypothetical protein VIS19158_21286 [Vibrio scophthalmi LMG 19158]
MLNERYRSENKEARSENREPRVNFRHKKTPPIGGAKKFDRQVKINTGSIRFVSGIDETKPW